MPISPHSLRLRLSVWFTLGVAAIVSVFVLATLYHLKEELIDEKAKLDYPEHPDYVLHGSLSSDAEISEIVNELLLKTLYAAGPLLLLVIALGWFLAGRSLRPIAELSRQLHEVRPKDLKSDHLVLPEGDREFQDHVKILNNLLGRLGKSFDDLSEYAAKVAHELRTPLTILRLKVEASDSGIDPELREELADELERLNHVVDQSLLIAKAERGGVQWESLEFDLAATLKDLVADFQLLATEDGRELVLRSPEHCVVRSDPGYLKQILQGYLTNALKHGSGRIELELTRGESSARVVLLNSLPDAGDDDASSLGLGLRVTKALVSSQDRVTTRSAVEHGRFKAEIAIPLDGSGRGSGE